MLYRLRFKHCELSFDILKNLQPIAFSTDIEYNKVSESGQYPLKKGAYNYFKKVKNFMLLLQLHFEV